jgi:large subunit ribosomal protein L28
MAKRCELCGKGPVVGRQHSHANNVSARRFEPNLQSVKAVINGGNKRVASARAACAPEGRQGA